MKWRSSGVIVTGLDLNVEDSELVFYTEITSVIRKRIPP